jgi:hypothetical protein
MEFAQKQIPNVKRWLAAASHEGNEYHGRASQLIQVIERDLPRLLALLSFTVDRLAAYAAVNPPGTAPNAAFMKQMSTELQTLLASIESQKSGSAEVSHPTEQAPDPPSSTE